MLSSRNRGKQGLEVDFTTLQRLRGSEEDIYFYTASQAETKYSLLYEIPRANVNAHPDTVFFSATKAFRKRVPVVAQLAIDYRPGFMLYNFPILSPDSVYISGPEALKDSVNFINTEMIKANRVDKNLEMVASLVNPLPDNLIKISRTQVEVQVPVEEFTEATVELPLEINCPEIDRHFPESKILLFPENVDIHYLVALKDIKTITPDMFKITVQCPDTTAQGKSRLPILVTEHPGLVDIIRARPPDVEYVWIKN